MMCKLSDICEFVKGKVAVSTLTKLNYISTENMLPNRGGIVEAATLPSTDTTQIYSSGDILVSNIRPYFKKIWFADTNGGCSNDVLVFRAKQGVNPIYLYYILSDDKFFNYATATSKGTKMPRGDKVAIMAYEIEKHTCQQQDVIASILKSLDDKIALNREINNNLAEQAMTLFKHYYDHATDEVNFTDLIQILGGGTPKTSTESYWNGEIPFFTPKDVGNPYVLTTEKYITDDGLAHCNSRLYPINTVFVTARGTVGKVSIPGVPMAMNQSCYALVGKEIPQLLVYFYTMQTVAKLKHKAMGAVFDAITTRDFETEQIKKLDGESIMSFISAVEPIYGEILALTKECQQLSALRDALLPKLMSGELDISEVEI